MKLQAKLVLAVGALTLLSFGVAANLDYRVGEVTPYLLQMFLSFLSIFWLLRLYAMNRLKPLQVAAAISKNDFNADLSVDGRDEITDIAGIAGAFQGEAVSDLSGRAAQTCGTGREIRAEKAPIRNQEGFQRTVARISTRFVKLPTADTDEGIDFALAELGDFCGVDRAYVFLYNADGITMSNTHEWCAPGTSPQMQNLQNLPYALIPWWMHQMERREVVDIPSVADLPEEAANERRIFQEQEIQSLVAVPMVAQGKPVGFLGFDSVRQEKSWPAEDLAMLQTAGEIVVNALERKNAKADLQKSEARFRDIAMSVADWIWEIDERGAFTFCSERVEEILGFTAEALLGRPACEFMPAGEAALARGILGPLKAEKQPIRDLENWVFRRDGKMARILTNGVPILEQDGSLKGYRGVSKDITVRWLTEASLHKVNRALRTLSAANAAIHQTTSEEELLAEMCRVATATGDYRMAWVGYAEDNGNKEVHPVAWAGHAEGYLQAMAAGESGSGPAGAAIRSGERVLSRNIAEDTDCEPWRRRALQHGYTACLALPLKEGEKCFGVFAIYASEPEAFEEEELELLSELAGKLAHGILALRAADRQRDAEEAIERERASLQTVLDGIADPVVVVDPDRRVILRNRAAMAHQPDSSPEEEPIRCYQLFHDRSTSCDGEDHRCPLEMVLETGQPTTMVHKRYNANEEKQAFEIKASPLWQEDGSLGGMIKVSRNITEHVRDKMKLLENDQRIHSLSYHDPLTTLPNRVLLQDRLNQAIAKARRAGGKVALLFLDLDRFKTVINSLGHAVGDRVLCEVARRLRWKTRKADTLARFGGDEFVVVLEEIEDEADVAYVVRRLQSALRPALKVDDFELSVTASIGISIFPADAEDFTGMMKCADIAMYRAKGQGRNSYQFYRDSMTLRTQELFLLENDLRKALENNQFVLHYQPQIDLGTGHLVGMEALLRWRHPERGMVSPADFIPLAEETGLIVPIGEWVLREACAQNRAWQEAGYPPVKMAVNISSRQFQVADFVDQVERTLADTGLDPRWLELEITESVVMENVEEAIMTLTDLKIRGISLSIDDFGTGYSSLSYLKRFPITNLKIDRSFVREIPDNPHDVAITTSIIALARSMGLEVVAEGVEKEEQLLFLRERGCLLGQGFLFSRPLLPAELIPVLETGSCRKPSSALYRYLAKQG